MVLLCSVDCWAYIAVFYAWQHKPESNRSKEDRCLLGLIKESFKVSQGIYGSKRIFCELREVGETCSVDRVATIMLENKIAALRGYKSHRFHYHKPAKAAPNRL